MRTFTSSRSAAALVALGFIAGFLSTLVFHQIAIGLLSALGVIPTGPYSMRGVPPFGVPQVLNLAFWGGVWGCVWALVVDRVPRAWPLWLAGLLFGAIAPTLVAWFVVAPLKGQALAQGFNPARMWIAPLVNGAWGLGTALIYELLRRRFSVRRWS